MAEVIYIVIGGGLVIAAYRGINGATMAGIHSRCITGATVVPCDLEESLPPEIRNDIAEEWAGDSDTPIVTINDVDDA